MSKPALAALFALLFLAAPAQAQFVVGVAGPMSGPLGPYGAQMAEGVRAAADQINARGGLGGETVELLVVDDYSDPTRAESVAQTIVEGGARVVVGHFTSAVAAMAAPVYARAGIIMLTPAASDPTLTDAESWNVFRLAARDDRQAAVSGRHIANAFADGRVALVHDKSAYGKGLVDRTRAVINEAGLNDVFYAGIDIGETSYAPLVARLRDARVDVVYFGGLHKEAAIILREMREAGLDAAFVTGDGALSPEFVTLAGDAVEGALMTAPIERDALDRDLQQARDAIGLTGGRTALASFVALRVVEEVVATLGSTDMRLVAGYLREGGGVETEIGPIGFDARGDATFTEFGLFAWRRAESGFVDYRDNLILR
ncbi:MAG: branched-chain amino acid ABC transporter substrate-binding protein [Salinarimonadaceae bacterium]|nr:MAG: branched-chain amino acid ABC transporter substrate-binding protein [Salinarimonadaceae bacterium]